MADGVKTFLERKLNESKIKVDKLKRSKRINNILFVITTTSSIMISVVLASISAMSIPPIVITIWAITSGFLTGISARFNIQDETYKISREIWQLNKIQSKFQLATALTDTRLFTYNSQLTYELLLFFKRLIISCIIAPRLFYLFVRCFRFTTDENHEVRGRFWGNGSHFVPANCIHKRFVASPV